MAHNAMRTALDATLALAFRAGYHETEEQMRTATYTRVILRRRSAALCAVESFGGWDVTTDGIVIPLSTNRSSRVAEVLAPVAAATAIMRGAKRVVVIAVGDRVRHVDSGDRAVVTNVIDLGGDHVAKDAPSWACSDGARWLELAWVGGRDRSWVSETVVAPAGDAS